MATATPEKYKITDDEGGTGAKMLNPVPAPSADDD